MLPVPNFVPDSVVSIGEWGFRYATRLSRVYFMGEPPASVDGDVFEEADTELVIYYVRETPGWEEAFAGRPTEPFVLWEKYAAIELFGGLYVDTGDWLGWLEVSSDPWIWCTATNSWIYIPEDVASVGQGWIYFPKLR